MNRSAGVALGGVTFSANLWLARVAPASWAALALVLAEGLVALTVGPEPVLAACVLLLAPGLAVSAFLPRALAAPAVRIVIVPIAGAAVSSIGVITLSTIRIPLDGLSIRLLLLAIALASVVLSALGLATARRQAAAGATPGLSEWVTLAVLGAILAVGAALQGLIVGTTPVPGADWGHYLLYADQIGKQHSLLIDNPYWMLGGRQFAEDPGIPSLYGAFVLLSEREAAVLAQGIWLFAGLVIGSLFVFVATLWGRTAGLIACALYAVVPMTLNILAWHGLANVWALVLLPLVLLGGAMALRGAMDARWAGFLAVALIALAAAHRLSFLVAIVTLVPCVAVCLWRTPRSTVRWLALVALTAGCVGAGVIVDLVLRNATTQGVQDYRAFAVTKVDWGLVGRDLTTLFGVMGAAALVVVLIAPRLRDDYARLIFVAYAGAILLLSYAWVAHVPTVYYRAAYFIPLVLAAVIGVACATYARGWLLVPVVVGLCAVMLAMGLDARADASRLRTFYGYASPASLRGLGYVKALARPGDVVVTDTCWGFLASWLLAQPTIAAQDPSLILPKAEVAPARTARRILYGGPAGAALARRIGARFALVDPQCTHQTGRPVKAPDAGVAIYASTRLVVLDLRGPPARSVR